MTYPDSSTTNEAVACVDCGGRAEGGMVKCWPCCTADLTRRLLSKRDPKGDRKARPSPGRGEVRTVRTPTFVRTGAA